MTKTHEDCWRLLPIAGWLPQYQRAWLRFDVVAGVTLAAYAVPVSLAYAGLAGLPQMGLTVIWSQGWVTQSSDRRGIWRLAPRP